MEPTSRLRWCTGVATAAVLMILPACEDDEIRTYRVPRHQHAEGPNAPVTPPPSEAPPDQPGGMADRADEIPPRDVNPDALPVEWTVPENWRRVENPNRFRVATFEVTPPGDEEPMAVAISSLRADGGGLRANLNRWRRQIGLPLVETIDQVESAVTFEGEGTRGVVFDMVGVASDGGPPPGMIAAVVRTPDRSWYVKLFGPASRIAPHRDEILAFAKSFQPRDTGRAAPDKARTTEPSVPPQPSADPDSAQPRWTTPPSWRRVQQTPPMLHALFHASADGADEPARISIVPLSGRAGGELPNINRWRRQLRRPPVASLQEADIQTLDGPAGEINLVDIAQPADQPDRERTIAAWVKHGGVTWFFKITGPAPAVAAHADAFRDFVASVRFDGSS